MSYTSVACPLKLKETINKVGFKIKNYLFWGDRIIYYNIFVKKHIFFRFPVNGSTFRKKCHNTILSKYAILDFVDFVYRPFML